MKSLATLCLLLSATLLPAQNDTITRGPFSKTIILDGKLTAHRAEKVFAPRGDSWQIQIKWLAEEGSHVKPGDPLARFDNSGILDRLQSLQDELAAMYQDVARKKAESDTQEHEKRIGLKKAEIDYEKAKIDAAVPENLIKGMDYRDNQLNLIKAEKELEKAKLALANQLANTQSELSKLNLEIERKMADYRDTEGKAQAMEKTAKTEGYVLYAMLPWEGRKVQVGDNVQATLEVVSIPDMTSLEVVCYAGESEATWLHAGQKARLVMDAYPDEAFVGRVVDVSNRGEVRRRWGKAPVFMVRVVLESRDLEKMRSGMSVRTEITVVSKEDVLLVPVSMVSYRGGVYQVKPVGRDPVTVEPIGINSFHMALTPGGALTENTRLERLVVRGGQGDSDEE